MFYTVYKITNTITGKIYIGAHKTNDLNDGYMGSGKHLKAAIRKYGVDSFSKEILKVCSSSDEMFRMEQQIVDAAFREYGVVNPSKLPFVRKKISLRMKFAYASGKRTSRLTGLEFKGKTHTEESKLKISMAVSSAQKGAGNSQYGTMWITDGSTSKKIKKNSPVPDGWVLGRKCIHSSVVE